MANRISPDQIRFFDENGFLILRDLLSPIEVENLQKWSREVHDWPATTDSGYMPYQEINAAGERVLCRTENYVDYHVGFKELLRGPKLIGLLSQIAGEDMLLFKEKINYKLAGSGGFSPHIDAAAYTHVKNIKHLTILLAVDASNMTNGGLEVVSGSHNMDIPMAADRCIEPEWVAQQHWTPVELKPGELLVFGSYLAHRSAANNSDSDRKAVYATYNCASEGDLHQKYYEDRKLLFPATHMRKKGEDYAEGSLRYAFGSPQLSIELGKQLKV